MSKASGESKAKGIVVVHETSGVRQPFLRGMLTHELVQRGMEFEDAYATARAIRDQIADRDEITASELTDLVDERIERSFGPEFLSKTSVAIEPPMLRVTYDGEAQPFSRGLLAQSILATGLDHDRAYRRVLEIQEELLHDSVERIDSRSLARFVADFLDRSEGAGVGGRYRLLRRLGRLNKPLIVFAGGATGVGKSTLSLDLAPLLRVYRINSTDTIRQVMRMVFSPAMLPALHRSSYEPGGYLGEDFSQEALAAGFEEQATRVCVGVRAVVERAISENLSVFVEGVHLLPPLVPFADLAGAAYQVMILLTTQDEEVHRSHFLARARVSRGRRSERYLDHFKAIRWQQELLLQRAEEHEIPLIDTADREGSTQQAVRLLTSLLERQVPWLAEAHRGPRFEPPPVLMLVIDGVADHPIRSLGGRTPLEAADTPTLDRLAREGICGLADPVVPGVVPDTAAGTLALFGQAPQSMNRGPIEALGADFSLQPGDIALRGNFATLDGRGWVMDRRAGRIRDSATELASALDRLEIPGLDGDQITVRVKPATEHRLAIVLRGQGLSSEIVGSDPGEAAPAGPPVNPHPLDPEDKAAIRTAGALTLFEQEARRVLKRHSVNRRRIKKGLPPANCVLTRGAGRAHQLPPIQPLDYPLKVACISGDRTVLGLARFLGARCISTPEMTANLDTDLKAKMKCAAKALESTDLVVVHVKGADIAAHDQRPDLKVAFLEDLDKALERLLKRFSSPLRVVIASDHTTYSESGRHGAEPVPVAIWGEGIRADEVQAFDERSASAGSLGRFPLQLLIDRVFQAEPTLDRPLSSRDLVATGS